MDSLKIAQKFATRILTLLVAIAALITGSLYGYIEWFGRRAVPQRADKEVDLKLSGRIDRVEEKIDRIQDRLDTVKLWAIGAVVTLIAGFAGVIITLLQR